MAEDALDGSSEEFALVAGGGDDGNSGAFDSIDSHGSYFPIRLEYAINVVGTEPFAIRSAQLLSRVSI